MNEDKSTRYNRRKRRVSIYSTLWSALFLVVLAVSGAAPLLRSASEAVARNLAPVSWLPSLSVAIFVVLMTLAYELVGFPLGLYGSFILERRYGMLRQSFRGWLNDQARSIALSLVLSIAGACLLYAIIRAFPDIWWLPAGLAFALVIVVLANIAPLLLLPLFYSIKPLTRESLRVRLVSLGERAGAAVLDAYEWGLGAKTSKANAALTGIGRSRRILVSDTMLADYTDDEIEVVLAHELAHHVHGDIWKALIFEACLIVLGFLAASSLLRVAVPVFGLRGPDDVAGLPLLLLAAGAVSLVMMPAARAMSRAHERRADRFALSLTKNAPAFVSAMRRLAAQNMAEDEPSRLTQWLFHSHPPIRERIAAAQAFKNS